MTMSSAIPWWGGSFTPTSVFHGSRRRGQAMIHLETRARLNPRLPLSRSELLPLLTAILDCLGLQDRDLSLQCVDDRQIAVLNEAFLGCKGPTNILSFPAS